MRPGLWRYTSPNGTRRSSDRNHPAVTTDVRASATHVRTSAPPNAPHQRPMSPRSHRQGHGEQDHRPRVGARCGAERERPGRPDAVAPGSTAESAPSSDPSASPSAVVAGGQARRADEAPIRGSSTARLASGSITRNRPDAARRRPSPHRAAATHVGDVARREVGDDQRPSTSPGRDSGGRSPPATSANAASGEPRDPPRPAVGSPIAGGADQDDRGPRERIPRTASTTAISDVDISIAERQPSDGGRDAREPTPCAGTRTGRARPAVGSRR